MPREDIKFSSKIKVFQISERFEMQGEIRKRRNFHSTTTEDGSVDTKEKLIEILQYYKAGETVTVTVQTPGNGGYTERQVEVTLGQASGTK